MNYIVLDLEWNQSPSGKEDSVEHLPFEIIEIGAVKLDSQFREVDSFHRLVKPAVYQELHFKITEVTHMDMNELEQEGESFPKVMEAFLSWCGEESIRFCTWGSMDLTELQRNIAYHGLENLFPRPLLYLDIQKLYSLQYGDGKPPVPGYGSTAAGYGGGRALPPRFGGCMLYGKDFICSGYGTAGDLCIRGLLQPSPK